MKKRHVETDERVEQESNKLKSEGFLIWGLLLSLDLMYRIAFLNQHSSQYIDILLILLIGNGFWLFRSAATGLLSEGVGRVVKYGFLVGTLVLIIAAALTASLIEIKAGFVLLLIGIPCVITVFGLIYMLDAWWKRKNNFKE